MLGIPPAEDEEPAAGGGVGKANCIGVVSSQQRKAIVYYPLVRMHSHQCHHRSRPRSLLALAASLRLSLGGIIRDC